jgi:hypothetical protein
MRPITGTAIGLPGLVSSSEAMPALAVARTRPRSPSMTLGLKPRERPLRHAGLGQALMDEAQQLELLAGQHLDLPVGRARKGNSQKQIMNEHYLFKFCSATI